MRIMRYLLITFAVMMISLMAVSAKAQTVAQPPQPEFRSTSSMVWSGSTLPQAAQSGVYTTYDYGTRSNKPGIRRVGEDEGFEEGETDPETPGEPFPIGEGMWAMVLLACAYVLFRYVRARKSASASR